MAVPAPNLTGLTIEQLFQQLHAGAVGSPMHQQATFMLQYRLAEKQLEAAQLQVTAANQLATFTKALVAATRALFVVGGATAVLTVVQIVIALGVVGRPEVSARAEARRVCMEKIAQQMAIVTPDMLVKVCR